MSSKVSTPIRLVRCPKCRKVLPEPTDVAVYSCGGCGQILQAKKRKNDTEDTPQRKPEEDSSGKQKMEQVSDDQKPSSSTNYSINEPDRKTSDHNDLDISSEILGQDEDTAKKEEICMVDSASDGVKEYSSGKQKMEQDVSMDEVIDGNNLHNDPRSSTELSGHGDPESSPEARAHNRKDQNRLQEQEEEQDQDQDVAKSRSRSRSPEAAVHDSIDKDREPIDGDLKICKNEVEFEESSRELTTSSEKSSYSELENPSRKAIGDTKIGRDFNRGSRSSFKNMIADTAIARRFPAKRRRSIIEETTDPVYATVVIHKSVTSRRSFPQKTIRPTDLRRVSMDLLLPVLGGSSAPSKLPCYKKTMP